MRVEDASWFPFSDEAVVRGGFFLPSLTDPALVLPEEAPDGRWHLLCQSWLGLVHCTSTNGISWRFAGRLSATARHPSLARTPLGYAVCYVITAREGRDEHAQIVVRYTADFVSFTRPSVVLDSEDVQESGGFLGHPHLVEEGGIWRLYFTTGLIDGRWEKSLACAVAPGVDGPYRRPRIVTPADADSRWHAMGIGPFAVVRTPEGWSMVAASDSWDVASGSVVSALVAYGSEDGYAFTERKRIFPAPRAGWAAGTLEGLALAWRERERTWYCYYSVRKGSRGAIGLLLGKNPKNPPLFGHTE